MAFKTFLSAVKSLSSHEGGLSLNGLTELSDAAAKSFGDHKDYLELNGIQNFSFLL